MISSVIPARNTVSPVLASAEEAAEPMRPALTLRAPRGNEEASEGSNGGEYCEVRKNLTINMERHKQYNLIILHHIC